jgi:hypothetical protein
VPGTAKFLCRTARSDRHNNSPEVTSASGLFPFRRDYATRKVLLLTNARPQRRIRIGNDLQ